MFKILSNIKLRMNLEAKAKYFAVSSHYYPYICCWSYVFITKIANKKYNVQFRCPQNLSTLLMAMYPRNFFTSTYSSYADCSCLPCSRAYFIFTQIYHNVQFVLILIFKMRQRKKEEEEEGNFIWLRWLHTITYKQHDGSGCMEKCVVFIVDTNVMYVRIPEATSPGAFIHFGTHIEYVKEMKIIYTVLLYCYTRSTNNIWVNFVADSSFKRQ